MEFTMEHLFYTSLALLALSYLLISKLLTHKPNPPLPPGSLGWPLIGETIRLYLLCRTGKPEEFIKERMQTHNKDVFKTSIVGNPVAILCGPAGNRFLFASEKKLVLTYWPVSLKKLFGDSFFTAPYHDAVMTRKVIVEFLRQEALLRFVERFDTICKKSLRDDWIGKEKVKSFPLIKKYAFSIACELFASIDHNSDQQARLMGEFNVLLKGVFQLPIYIPGTRHYKAVKSASRIRRELLEVIEEKRKRSCGDGGGDDLISHLMVVRDEEGRLLTDKEIADNVILLMDAGHDTSSCTMMSMIKYLAEMPDCYQKVLEEQREIASSKGEGELLNKDDIQKMKYAWNVVCEVLRMSPPIQGTFREAITDFNYAGFFIPMGWKVGWTVNSTHKVAEYFPDPEKFDPLRFKSDAPIPYAYTPFGGGPRMCPGREFARLEILVFLYNLVQEFKWALEFPNEKISVDPMPAPSKGLPIYLYPHSHL